MPENQNDLEQITQTVDHYFKGMYHSDVDRLKKAFHASAFLKGYFQGNLAIFSIEDWLKVIQDTPPPADNGEAYDMKIVSVDITDNVACVKVADLYKDLRFTDYLSLMKIEENWVIVNKTFYHEPKS